MKEFSKFLVDYWQVIILGIISLISLVFNLVRNRPLVNLYDDSFYKDLAILINEAEKAFPQSGSGELKMQYVINNFLQKHQFENQDIKFLVDFCIKPIVEKLLSLPSKK